MLKLLELVLQVGGKLPYFFNKRPGLDTVPKSWALYMLIKRDTREIDPLSLMIVLKR